MDAILPFGKLTLVCYFFQLVLLLFLSFQRNRSWWLFGGYTFIIFMPRLRKYFARIHIFSQFTQLFVGRPQSWILLECFEIEFLSICVSGLFFTDNSKKVEAIAAISHIVSILNFHRLWAKECFFGLFVFVDLDTAYCEFVAISFVFGLLKNVKNFIVLVLGKIAVS